MTAYGTVTSSTGFIGGRSTFTFLTVTGDARINGNDIQDSGGNNQITFTAGSLATLGYDLKITGNDIQALCYALTVVGIDIGIGGL